MPGTILAVHPAQHGVTPRLQRHVRMFGDAGRGGHQPNEFVTPIHGFNRTDAQLLQRSFGEDGVDEIFKPGPSAIGRWSVAGFPGG